jgi:hypothetical protein
MKFDVHFICAYYSEWASQNVERRKGDYWDAFKFVKAVKSRHINGTATIPLKSNPIHLHEGNVGEARRFFGRALVHRLRSIGLDCATLIPVPSKDERVGRTEASRSFSMVKEAMENHPEFKVAPILRFTREMAHAHAGGTRDRRVIYEATTVEGASIDGPVVLVDDLVTLGGSILAARDRLREVDVEPVCAFVAGRTVHDFLTTPFGRHVLSVEDDNGLSDFE